MATTARYTIDELLKLRTLLPTFNCILEKVNKHPDIGKFLIYISERDLCVRRF